MVMVPQTYVLASSTCRRVNPRWVSRSNPGASYTAAGIFNVSRRKASPRVQRLNTNGSSNAPGRLSSTFCSTSSVNPLLLRLAGLTCGQPWRVAAPLQWRTMSSTCHGA